MALLTAVGGSRLLIGGVKSAKSLITLADFAGEVWTEIDGWTQAGALGDEQEIISQSVISGNRMRKLKGLLDGGTMENTFLPNRVDPGQIAYLAAVASCRPYAFRVEWSAGCQNTATVTFTAATPGLVNWAAHGLVAGTPVIFTTTGVLPVALTAGQIYYVVAPVTAGTFAVSATLGGAAITFAAAGTGVHTATSADGGSTDMFFGLAMPGKKQGGDASAARLRSWSIAVDSNIIEV